MNIRTNTDGSIEVLNISNERLIGISENGVSINGGAGNDVHIGDDETRDLILSGDRVLVKFVAADPGSWQGAAPTYLHDAINRLAAALTAAGHKP